MAETITVSACSADEYEAALDQLKPSLKEPIPFLQAPFYGQWQQASGKTVIYYVIKKDAVLGCGIAVQYALPAGGTNFLYCPYGPLLAEASKDIYAALWAFFQPLSAESKNIFVRLDNAALGNLTGVNRASNALSATSSLQPRTEWVLDITPSSDLLIADFHKMARYHVRLAERNKARVVIESPSEQQVDKFYTLLETTSERNDFGIMDKSYYEAVFAALDAQTAFVALCYVGDKLAAAALFVIYDNQAHYVFAASSNEFRKLAPSYFLQWKAILEAQKRGCTLYNFGGIEDNVKKLHLAGVEKFKKRFGGYAVTHPNPVDLVYRPLNYQLFRLYKTLRYHSK
ncbi:MAG: peptidoglycan bridge formation glycyltransferase FemA/FemB family protein [Candidatus Saccharimonadales bacterium]